MTLLIAKLLTVTWQSKTIVILSLLAMLLLIEFRRQSQTITIVYCGTVILFVLTNPSSFLIIITSIIVIIIIDHHHAPPPPPRTTTSISSLIIIILGSILIVIIITLKLTDIVHSTYTTPLFTPSISVVWLCVVSGSKPNIGRRVTKKKKKIATRNKILYTKQRARTKVVVTLLKFNYYRR